MTVALVPCYGVIDGLIDFNGDSTIDGLDDVGLRGFQIVNGGFDVDENGIINATDVDFACNDRIALEPYFEELNSIRGDIDFNGEIGFGDFLLLSSHFGGFGSYSQGDLNCSGDIRFDDFLLLSNSFGAKAEVAAIPEPTNLAMLIIGVAILSGLRRHRHD